MHRSDGHVQSISRFGGRNRTPCHQGVRQILNLLRNIETRQFFDFINPFLRGGGVASPTFIE